MTVYSCALTQPQLSQPCEHQGYVVAAAVRGELEMNRMNMSSEDPLQLCVYKYLSLEISAEHSNSLNEVERAVVHIPCY